MGFTLSLALRPADTIGSRPSPRPLWPRAPDGLQPGGRRHGLLASRRRRGLHRVHLRHGSFGHCPAARRTGAWRSALGVGQPGRCEPGRGRASIGPGIGLALPEARAGVIPSGLAHAAIDLSDGLVSELGHLVSASSAHRGEPLQAAVRMSALTDCLGPALRASRASRFQASLDKERWAAASGDAYELLLPPRLAQMQPLRLCRWNWPYPCTTLARC